MLDNGKLDGYVEPKVTLISWTRDPLKTIHAMTQNMFGNFITDLDTINEEDCLKTIEELSKTSLGGPLEAVDFVFQVEMVPRAFTHQAVRTRVGAMYSQESLRFLNKTGPQFKYDVGPSIKTDEQKEAYEAFMKECQELYNKLIAMGVAPEDARGVLPINVLTNIGIKWTLPTLIKVANVRMCTQSQAHWYSVIRQMKSEVAKKVHPALANMLQPFCAQNKKCGYKSAYDRPCEIYKQYESENK
jgi:thymidylate synthase (FAD)